MIMSAWIPVWIIGGPALGILILNAIFSRSSTY